MNENEQEIIYVPITNDGLKMTEYTLEEVKESFLLHILDYYYDIKPYRSLKYNGRLNQ